MSMVRRAAASSKGWVLRLSHPDTLALDEQRLAEQSDEDVEVFFEASLRLDGVGVSAACAAGLTEDEDLRDALAILAIVAECCDDMRGALSSVVLLHPESEPLASAGIPITVDLGGSRSASIKVAPNSERQGPAAQLAG